MAKARHDTGSVQFIGTATVLIRLGDFTILTDPNFIHKHEYIHLGYGLKAMRRTDPAMEVEDLPELDFILLSHFHEDHFDRVAQESFDKSTRIITNPGSKRALERRGFTNVESLTTWATKEKIKGDSALIVTAAPGRHGPGLADTFLPDVMGTILTLHTADDRSFRIYITGDTLLFEKIHEIPERYPDIDLALVHLGGTRIFGMLLTMDGEQGRKLLEIVQPKISIPIHYDDYTVFRSPLDDFRIEAKAAGLEPNIRYLNRGETYRF